MLIRRLYDYGKNVLENFIDSNSKHFQTSLFDALHLLCKYWSASVKNVHVNRIDSTGYRLALTNESSGSGRGRRFHFK